MADLRLGKLLKAARKGCGMLQRDVCAEMGVKQSTLSAWETGTAEPSLGVFLKLCRLYGIDDVPGYFGTRADGAGSRAEPFTAAEIGMLRKIRSLDERGYAALQNHLDFAVQWAEREGQAPAKPKFKYGLRTLPLFFQSAAAGLGNYLDEESSEMIEVDAPPEADAVVRISGDSMEPLIHDGDKIFLQYMPAVGEGEIGIFVLNGSAYCKQLHYENGVPLLVSLNPEYPPIRIREGDRIVTHGKVLLP